MKKYLLILLAFIPFIFAASIQDMHKAVVARKNAASNGSDWYDGFESNDFSAWTTSTGSGTVDAESKYGGNYGFHADFADHNVEHETTGESISRWIFWYKVNAETLADNEKTLIGYAKADGTTIYRIYIIDGAGTLYLDMCTDTAPADTYAISTGSWYKIMVEAKINSSTGYIKMEVDDNPAVNDTGLDTGSTNMDEYRFGNTGYQATSLDVYLDSFDFYDLSP